MVSFFGITFLSNQAVFKVFKKIKGVGSKFSLLVCKTLGLLPSTLWKELKEHQILHINTWLNDCLDQFVIYGNILNQIHKKKKKYLCSIKHYRGFRQVYRLPSRGQRTKSNSKSCKIS